MKNRRRPSAIPAALLALFLASGCVSVPKEPETAQTEADAGSSASADADSGASASY